MRPPFLSGGVAATLRSARWRVRRRLRSPALYWTIAVSVGLATTFAVSSLMAEAEEGAARFGESTTVVRARRDLPAGHLLGPADVVTVDLPRSAAPRDVDSFVGVGDRLAHPVVEGEVLGHHDVVDGELSSLAAQITPDRAAVAVPASQSAVDVEQGDLVDIWGLDQRTLVHRRLAAGAEVLDRGESSAVVSVEQVDLGPLIAAVGDGSATIVLRRPGGR